MPKGKYKAKDGALRVAYGKGLPPQRPVFYGDICIHRSEGEGNGRGGIPKQDNKLSNVYRISCNANRSSRVICYRPV